MLVRGLLAALLISLASAHAAEARIVKVLSHLLDAQGRHALSPSLYERDAYQVHLRENPELISALRFDLQYKARRSDGPVLLRLELRGSNLGLGQAQAFETESLPARFFSSWAQIQLNKTEARALGKVVAWRATLWRDGQMLAEQKSFLW